MGIKSRYPRVKANRDGPRLVTPSATEVEYVLAVNIGAEIGKRALELVQRLEWQLPSRYSLGIPGVIARYLTWVLTECGEYPLGDM
jgi:hypothetical protein